MEKNTDFKEEQLHLRKDVNQIKGEIHGLKQKIANLQPYIRTLPASSGEDVTNWQSYKAEERRKKEKAAELAAIVKKPYFERIDVMQRKKSGDVEVKTYYFGFHDYTPPGKGQTIFDWRCSEETVFRSDNKTEYVKDGEKYTLTLKRKLEIENSTLLECLTLFDERLAEITNNTVIDEYLLRVITRNRTNKRLSLIVETISKSQNEITRLPYNQNFIVQGCAGSGKTAILLHRLSVLHYRKDFQKYKLKPIILAPNKNIFAQCRKLCHELEIDYIEKYTIFEYLDYLYKNYSKYNDSGYRIIEDDNLNQSLLAAIYSIDFPKKLKEKYEEYITQLCDDPFLKPYVQKYQKAKYDRNNRVFIISDILVGIQDYYKAQIEEHKSILNQRNSLLLALQENEKKAVPRD